MTVVVLGVLCLALSGTSSSARAQSREKVVLVVATDAVARNLEPRVSDRRDPQDGLLRHYASLQLRTALLSTTQGEYSQRQALLDISQGTRQPQAVYGSPLGATALIETPSGWVVEGWADVRRRAREGSVTLRPGLFASTIGGATYIATDGASDTPALIAADEDGRVQEVSTGPDSTVLDRFRAAAASDSRLIVVSQPPGSVGRSVLSEILRSVADDVLVMALHLPPTPPEEPTVPNPASRFFLQTAVAADMAEAESGSLRSSSTRRLGLVTAIDIAPTALSHLNLEEPLSMRGHVMSSAEVRVDTLEDLRRRWSLVRAGRQGQAMRTTAMLALAIAVVGGIFRELSTMARIAARALGLALMALPAMAIITARLVPSVSSSTEGLLIAVGAVGIGVLSDRVLPWPAAPLVPSLASLCGVTVDLAVGGDGLAASVIGPSVASGNRFYGISNELEPILPALLLAAIAAVVALRRAEGPARGVTVAIFGVSGLLLAGVVAAGRLGADVGGVVTIAGGFAVAAVIASGTKPSFKLVGGAVALSAVSGLVLLIAVDQLAGANSHLANNLQRLQSPAEFLELFARRYQLAAHVATQPSQLVSLASAIVACAFVYRNRERLLGDLPSRFWRAALVGTLAGGACGALSNDSGPVLFVNSALGAGAIALYLGGGGPARGQRAMMAAGDRE